MIVFGDPEGISQLLSIGEAELCERTIGVVGASIRPSRQEHLAEMARDRGWPHLVQPRFDSPDYAGFVQDVANLRPDLLLVNSYSMILRPDVLSIPEYGGVNVHGAPLPECRGANPIEWSLIEDKDLAGVTIHRMDSGIDTGPVLGRRLVPLSFFDTWWDIKQRVGVATSDLLSSVLPSILAGDIRGAVQDESRAHQYRRRRPADGKFQWSWPVRRIYNMIRALVDPHPGAYVETEEGIEWFRKFLPIGEVASLKFAEDAGGQQYQSSDLSVMPTWTRERPGEADRRGRVDFHVSKRRGGDVVGAASIVGDDWLGGTGTLHVQVPAEWNDEARRLLENFAAGELGLRAVKAQ